ncbi:MAG: winged helix-turn-helix transcriptional regulator [Flavobacteriales bacterium]|nr:winged helix-turn-helix transcriptional regulator [Flavobacteriales bacterium]
MPMDYEFDDLDKQILTHLLNDSRMAYTELAKKLLISPGTVHVRMNKMENAGIVERATLKLNPHLLGYDVVAFIGLNFEKAGLYDTVIAQLKQIPEVVEAHYTTGNYGLFIKLICRNTEHLREVLQSKIQLVSGISKTETFLSLEEGISRSIPTNTF